MPGRRLASMDLPVPGAPMRSTLCPPAAAMHHGPAGQRLAHDVRKIRGLASRRRSGSKGSAAAAGRWAAMPRRASTTSRRRVGRVDQSWRRRRPRLLRPRSPRGHTGPGPPLAAAASAMGSTPDTGRRLPSSASSPRKAASSGGGFRSGRWPSEKRPAAGAGRTPGRSCGHRPGPG